jgi:hypothetical protein
MLADADAAGRGGRRLVQNGRGKRRAKKTGKIQNSAQAARKVAWRGAVSIRNEDLTLSLEVRSYTRNEFGTTIVFLWV